MDKNKLQAILTWYSSGKLKDNEAIEQICALTKHLNMPQANGILPLASNMFAKYCDFCEETTEHRIIHACQKCDKHI